MRLINNDSLVHIKDFVRHNKTLILSLIIILLMFIVTLLSYGMPGCGGEEENAALPPDAEEVALEDVGIEIVEGEVVASDEETKELIQKPKTPIISSSVGSKLDFTINSNGIRTFLGNKNKTFFIKFRNAISATEGKIDLCKKGRVSVQSTSATSDSLLANSTYPFKDYTVKFSDKSNCCNFAINTEIDSLKNIESLIIEIKAQNSKKLFKIIKVTIEIPKEVKDISKNNSISQCIKGNDYHLIDVNGKGDFKSINEAVNYIAEQGSNIKKVRVCSGTYHESVNISTSGITIESYDMKNPAVLDGADQELLKDLKNGAKKWEHVDGKIYKIPYKWKKMKNNDECAPPAITWNSAGDRNVTDIEFTMKSINNGDMGDNKVGNTCNAPMEIYENGDQLRGYRNRHDVNYKCSANCNCSEKFCSNKDTCECRDFLGGPYHKIEELDPAYNGGSKPEGINRPSIDNIHGRFYFDANSTHIYLWPSKENDPKNNIYNIPVIFRLITVKGASNTTIKGLVLKNSAGFAIVAKNTANLIVEDNFIINSPGSIFTRYSDGFKIRRNFIQLNGFYKRNWYDDQKATLHDTFGIEIDGFSASKQDGEIYDNLIHGQKGIFFNSEGGKIYHNIVSTGISALLGLQTGYGNEYKPELEVFNNVLHHSDYGAIHFQHVPVGILRFYRNVMYNNNYFVKDGFNEAAISSNKNFFNSEDGTKHIYNNTYALGYTLSKIPYTHPVYKKTIFKNNILHLLFGNNRFHDYNKYPPEMIGSYFPFNKGPLSMSNLLWRNSYDENIFKKEWGNCLDSNSCVLARFFLPINDPNFAKKLLAEQIIECKNAYNFPEPVDVPLSKGCQKFYFNNTNSFNDMVNHTGLEVNSIYDNPQFVNGTVIDKANDFSFNIDDFSTMDYEGAIKSGYIDLFNKSFNTQYNYFNVKSGSPVIDVGATLPPDWPDTVPIKDGKRDVGAVEY